MPTPSPSSPNCLPSPRRLARVGLLGLAALAGCESGPSTVESQARSTLSPARAEGGTPTANASDGRTVALVGQTRISSEDLSRALAEAAGASVLEEAAIDRLLDRELATAGLTVTPQDVRAEEDQLLATTAEQAKVSRDQAARALADLRRSRGLGPTRFAALLTRNAKLRALVKSSAVPDAVDLATAREAEVGERITARLVVRPDALSASQSRIEVVRQIAWAQAALAKSQEPAADGTQPGAGIAAEKLISAFVTQIALKDSIHPTASRGGLLDPLSPADPGVPAAVRDALTATAPGSLTAVLPLEQGFGFMLIESKTPGHAPSAEESAKIERAAAARAQRRAMDRLARDLVARAGVSVLDESLRWSWESRAR